MPRPAPDYPGILRAAREIVVKTDRDINKQAEDWWMEGGEDHVGEDLEG
jgi:hypothetical protein